MGFCWVYRLYGRELDTVVWVPSKCQADTDSKCVRWQCMYLGYLPLLMYNGKYSRHFVHLYLYVNENTMSMVSIKLLFCFWFWHWKMTSPHIYRVISVTAIQSSLINQCFESTFCFHSYFDVLKIKSWKWFISCMTTYPQQQDDLYFLMPGTIWIWHLLINFS